MTLTVYECPNECIVSPMPGECMQCDAVLVEAEYVPASELAALSWARWIPVSERLPEDRKEVLLITDDNDCVVGRWNEAVKRWDIKYSAQQFFRTYFAHWMELPHPPLESL